MRGRFAPSPTGPLHFGSLVAAVASYVDAKSCGGEWIVRIEDVDAARTVPRAADAILRSLEMHGLAWDHRSIMVQSTRTEAYQEALERLGRLVYPCGCSRKDVGGVYPGTCRLGLRDGREARAWRVRIPEGRMIEFTDRLAGRVRERLAETCGDFIVRRADGVFAYQLAVVVDDAAQGITDVVRGADLLESTARQVYLYEALGLGEAPRYLHVPVVTDAQGEKLSKQTNAVALNDSRAGESLWKALEFLKQGPPPELRGAAPRALLEWATANWNALLI